MQKDADADKTSLVALDDAQSADGGMMPWVNTVNGTKKTVSKRKHNEEA